MLTLLCLCCVQGLSSGLETSFHILSSLTLSFGRATTTTTMLPAHCCCCYAASSSCNCCCCFRITFNIFVYFFFFCIFSAYVFFQEFRHWYAVRQQQQQQQKNYCCIFHNVIFWKIKCKRCVARAARQGQAAYQKKKYKKNYCLLYNNLCKYCRRAKNWTRYRGKQNARNTPATVSLTLSMSVAFSSTHTDNWLLTVEQEFVIKVFIKSTTTMFPNTERQVLGLDDATH